MRNALVWRTGVEHQFSIEQGGIGYSGALHWRAGSIQPAIALTDKSWQPLIRANLAGARVVHRQRGRSLPRAVERLSPQSRAQADDRCCCRAHQRRLGSRTLTART